MDVDSVLILTGLLGAGLMPAWTIWFAKRFRKYLPAIWRTTIVCVLSVATLAVVHVLPFAIISIRHDTFAENLADPRFPIAMAMVFGPQFLVQIAFAAIMGHRSTAP